MKIIKTKKVETIEKEIEVENGIYFFSLGYKNEEPDYYYRIEIDHGN